MDQFKKALKIYFAMILFTIVIAALYSEMEYKLLFLVPFIVLFYSRYKYINFFKDRSFVSVVQLTSNEKQLLIGKFFAKEKYSQIGSDHGNKPFYVPSFIYRYRWISASLGVLFFLSSFLLIPLFLSKGSSFDALAVRFLFFDAVFIGIGFFYILLPFCEGGYMLELPTQKIWVSEGNLKELIKIVGIDDEGINNKMEEINV
jgi:hypothetical protein